MTFDVTHTILDYSGEPVKQGEHDTTWRDVIFVAFNSPSSPTENLPVDQKVKAYQITKKAFDSDTPDFNVEERAFILERIKTIYVKPLIIGRAIELFDGDNEK
jgi:hypothetical protein